MSQREATPQVVLLSRTLGKLCGFYLLLLLNAICGATCYRFRTSRNKPVAGGEKKTKKQNGIYPELVSNTFFNSDDRQWAAAADRFTYVVSTLMFSL